MIKLPIYNLFENIDENNIEEIYRAKFRVLLLTDKGELMYNPGYGGSLRKYLAESLSKNDVLNIKEDIKNMIHSNLPNLKLHSKNGITVEKMIEDDSPKTKLNINVTGIIEEEGKIYKFKDNFDIK